MLLAGLALGVGYVIDGRFSGHAWQMAPWLLSEMVSPLNHDQRNDIAGLLRRRM